MLHGNFKGKRVNDYILSFNTNIRWFTERMSFCGISHGQGRGYYIQLLIFIEEKNKRDIF